MSRTKSSPTAKAKYPIGTRFVNHAKEERYVDWIEIIEYPSSGGIKARLTSGSVFTYDNLNKLESALLIPRWRIEYPKEELFTKLYLKLKYEG